MIENSLNLNNLAYIMMELSCERFSIRYTYEYIYIYISLVTPRVTKNKIIFTSFNSKIMCTVFFQLPLTLGAEELNLTHLCPPLRSTFAVRETASLGIRGAPRVPSLNHSETIVL